MINIRRSKSLEKCNARKHRYIYLTGSKKWKKKVRNLIKYKQEEYPKS
jgi:hypothetical protein